MGKTAINERRKLTATFLNNIALFLVATAAAGPLITVFVKPMRELGPYLVKMITEKDNLDYGLGIASALIIAAFLHLWERHIPSWRTEFVIV